MPHQSKRLPVFCVCVWGNAPKCHASGVEDGVEVYGAVSS